MKIEYVAFIRLPTERAHGLQIMKTCEALAARGHEVELVVPGRRTQIADDPFTYYGVKHNFSLAVLGTPDWVRFGAIGFLFSLLWFSEAAARRKGFWSADVVYCRDAAVLAQYLLLGRRLIYEAHTKPTWVSRFAARRTERLIVISEGLRDAYLAAGISAEKITVAHDAIDAAPFTRAPDKVAARQKLGIPGDKVVALYVGRLDVEKGAATLARAAESLPDTHSAVLIGSGPLAEVLKRTYQKALILPETPYASLSSVLAAADILVLPNSAESEDSSRYTSPLKAFAYLAAKKPIIASDVPALHAIFGDEVQYVRPDNPDDLSDAIQNKGTLGKIPSRAPRTWDTRAAEIEAAIT